MRIIFYMIGVIASLGGVCLVVLAVMDSNYRWLGFCGGAALASTATVHFVAGARHYQGHWSFVIGTGLITLAFVGIGSEIDDALAHRSESPLLGVFMVLLFSISGALSLWSAHRLHRCSVELERYAKNNAA